MKYLGFNFVRLKYYLTCIGWGCCESWRLFSSLICSHVGFQTSYQTSCMLCTSTSSIHLNPPSVDWWRRQRHSAFSVFFTPWFHPSVQRLYWWWSPSVLHPPNTSTCSSSNPPTAPTSPRSISISNNDSTTSGNAITTPPHPVNARLTPCQLRFGWQSRGEMSKMGLWVYIDKWSVIVWSRDKCVRRRRRDGFSLQFPTFLVLHQVSRFP